MPDMTEYKCPSCGYMLKFDPESGKLVCHSCGNKYDVEAMDAYKEADNSSEEFDWSAYKKDFETNEHIDDMNVYVCKSCGATIEADKTTAATTCPYCGNNVILDDRLSGGLKPNAIIPFKIMPKDVPGMIRRFCKGKHLLPKGFFKYNIVGKLQGVYIPFWLYDCHMDGRMMFNAVRIRSYRMGAYDCTETMHFLLERDGEMSFAHIPVDASERMDNDLMDSVEPFDFSEMVDFEKGYLSGFIADRYDTDPEVEMPRASLRMKNSATQAYMSTTPFYTNVNIRSNNVKICDPAVKYVLLPVYLLNCTYKGRKYRYAINGQTGKIVGELPISKKKMALWGLAVGGGSFAALFAIFFNLMGGVL